MGKSYRTVDKSALAKTFGLFLLSIIFLVTYGGNLAICNGDNLKGLGQEVLNDFGDIQNSQCRMSLYNIVSDPTDGPVKLWYYLLIWAIICGLSVLGFFLLLCNCSQCLTRVYALALIAMAVCITIAEAHNCSQLRLLQEELLDLPRL